MKKYFLLLLAGLFVAYTGNAQSTFIPKKFSWGYKIGLNGSTIRMKNGHRPDWKLGLATGLFFNHQLGSRWSIQPELLYSSMGGRNVTADEGSSLRLNYFSLPLLARYQACQKLALLAGPQMDMLIQAKTKSSSNQFAKVTDDYKEGSFNLTGGIEYWPAHCLGFSARYIHGVNNIATTGKLEWKNQGVQVMAAVKF